MNITMFKDVATTATRMLGKVTLYTNKHAPEILTAAGIGFGGASIVTACKATLKVTDIHNEYVDISSKIEKYNTPENNASGIYTDMDAKTDARNLTIQTIVKYVKLYAPSVLFAGASVACLLSANKIMRQRVAALTAAYTAVDDAFRRYRSRVVEELGAEADRRFRYGEPAKIENNDESNADEMKDSKFYQTGRYAKGNMYSRFFDESSKYFRKIHTPEDIGQNKFFITCQERQANKMLHSRGYLFLNEVYELLGFRPTDEGSVVGWVLGGDGDGYVDFGCWDSHNPAKRAFINETENYILLDFNVDGVIYGLLNQMDL